MFKFKRDRGLSAVPVVVILMLCGVVVGIFGFDTGKNTTATALDGTYQAYETITGEEMENPYYPPGSAPSGGGNLGGGSGGSGGAPSTYNIEYELDYGLFAEPELVTLSWNGATSGKPSFTSNELVSGYVYYRVSENVPTTEDFWLGTTLEASVGLKANSKIGKCPFSEKFPGVYSYSIAYVVVVTDDTTIEGQNAAKGIYFAKATSTGAYASKFTYYKGDYSNPNPNSYVQNIGVASFVSPIKTGYTFGGWYDNDTFDGEPITSILAGTTGDIKLYAKWN